MAVISWHFVQLALHNSIIIILLKDIYALTLSLSLEFSLTKNPQF